MKTTRRLPFTTCSFKRFVLLAGRNARAFAALGKLTPARADMMQAMLFTELTQKELGLALGISKAVVSRMVRALEGLGMVARRTPDEDRRVRLVSLTEAGRKRLDIYYDGWTSDDGKGSIQAGAECELLMNWEKPLASAGIKFEFPWNDVGPVMRHIRAVQESSDYWAEDFGVEEARTMRCHRNYKDPSRNVARLRR